MVFIFPFLLLSCFLEVPTRVPLFNFLCQALHDDIKNTNFANCICQLMIKKIIIRILSIVMLIAFIAVVSVQWIWMKYSMREGEARFTSKVYDVLGKAVSLVDQVSERKLYQEVKEQYNILEEQIAATDQMLDSLEKGKEQRLRTNSASVSIEMQQANGQVTIRHMSVGYQDPLEEYSRYLQEISRSIREVTDRSFPHQLIKSEEEEVKQQTDSLDGQRLSDMIRKVVIRYMKEEDPHNADVAKRLEGVDLDIYLKDEMASTGIKNHFKWKVMKGEELLKYIKEHGKKGFYYTDLFPNDQIKKDANLCIMFDTKDSLFYNNIGWMFIASGFCIIGLMSVFIITIVVIMRQQKLSVIKNDFINNMTHEFKTPLATISLATAAIEKEKVLNDKNQLLKFNSMIRNENERMNKYVERILLQAKLDRREVHLKKVNVNLNVLVDETVEHFRLQVEERGGVIKADLDPEGYVMQADEIHMLNVVCNLVDNAIKYSHDSLNIYIFTKREGNRFIIGVRDTGIGIPKEAQDKVFKRFYRVPSGNVHNVKGFGLGLSYARSIVELHGGEIHLTSKKNKGTLVEIIFKMEN